MLILAAYENNIHDIMSLINKHIKISTLLSYFVIFDLLTREEMNEARETGKLPDDVLQRLKIAEMIGKN